MARNKKPTKTNKRVSSAAATKRPSVFADVDWGRVRLWSVGILFILLWGALWLRTFQLQLIEGPKLAEAARRIHMKKELVTGVRGNIMDRNGNVMARSIDSSSVSINPQQIKDQAFTAEVLSKILNLDQAKLRRLMQKKGSFAWVARKVSDGAGRQVKAAALPGVYVSAESERVYPYKTLAGQLLGFVNTDDKGIEGLEYALDDVLGAQQVRQLVQRDATGRRLGGGREDVSDLQGKNVRLTLDTQVQFFAEEALAENVHTYDAKWGGCIVVDVPTGEILAWAQYPFFDPNSHQKYPPLVRKNRLATDALEQGSTIKSFLIAAALEEKVVAPSTVINCEKGKWAIGSKYIHDTHSYDKLTVDKILHVSSNIGVAKIGMKLGAKRYYDYLSKLGFGAPTNLPLTGQSKGILRPASQWQEIDLASSSFGQSFSATLVQMAKAYLCLASNGEAKELKLVFDEQNQEANEPQEAVAESSMKVFSPDTMRQVRAMLREVVEEEGGTGKNARIPGMVVGGKTGTAQKTDSRSRSYGSGRVGSFVGMVPIDNPQYLVCVMLDEPKKNQYGGVIAAPVFRNVALRTMAYHGLLPDTDDPLVKAIAEKEAARRAQLRGPSGVSSVGMAAGTGEIITENTALRPETRRSRPKTSIRQSKTVPNVVGLGVKHAVEVFVANGVVPSFSGQGSYVARQLPEPGSLWPADRKGCTLWLEDPNL